MRISVQTDDFQFMEEAVQSTCDDVRFGSEFCEVRIPNRNLLEKAYDVVHEAGKTFTYITPRLSNKGVEKVRNQLAFLNGRGNVRVVINDVGTLNVLKEHRNLTPHLGRQLSFIPARCPWADEIIDGGGVLARRWVRKVFASTSLNHRLTLEYYRKHGVEGVDVDWIPRLFPSFDFLVKKGLDLSLYVHSVPVIVARRCHTARFLGERNPEACSKPCHHRVFWLENDSLNVNLVLLGNVVFNPTSPTPRMIAQWNRTGIEITQNTELVVPMNPITGIDNRHKINDFIANSKVVKNIQ